MANFTIIKASDADAAAAAALITRRYYLRFDDQIVVDEFDGVVAARVEIATCLQERRLTNQTKVCEKRKRRRRGKSADWKNRRFLFFFFWQLLSTSQPSVLI